MLSHLDPATFASIHEYFVKSCAPPVLPPAKPLSSSTTSSIASLQVHPTLEAALHLLNLDLPSAHFLVRHMQAPPAYEGMLLHGILHRVEGDYDNARAWYRNVENDKGGNQLLRQIWETTGTGWEVFIDRIQASYKERTKPRDRAAWDSEKNDLEQLSHKEIEHLIQWCSNKFGVDKWEDASGEWVKPSEKHREIGEKMVSGGEGFRKF